MTWEVTAARSEALDSYLEDGWEPFGVYYVPMNPPPSTIGGFVVFVLRRKR